MRILHILNWFVEGFGYQENFLPLEQAKLGNDVLILCSKYPHRDRTPPITKPDKVYDVSLRIKRLDGIRWTLFTQQHWLFNLKEETLKFKPDVVHLHNLWTVLVLQFLTFSNQIKAKMFVDEHIDGDNFPSKPLKGLYVFGFIKRLIIPLMLRRGFTFLPSQPLAEWFLHHRLGVPKERIKGLYLGVNTIHGFCPKARKELREKYNIDD